MATDLDKWKTKPTIDVLQDAQCIVDKYRDQMQEADYVALCNANRVRYARQRRRGSPGSVNSNESQGHGFVQPTVEDFEYRISYLREKMERASHALRHLPHTVKVVTPSFKKRAIRAFADEMELDETVTTYDQLKAMFPEIKYEKDFYMTAMRIMNKRLHLIRQDLKNEIGAQKAAIKHLETRLHTNFRDGTSFLT
jgi:SRSO17 transposase